MTAATAFLPGDRIAWYSPYTTTIYSGTVEVVATSKDGDVARIRVDSTGEKTVVECAKLSLVPDARPAAVDAALSLIGLLAEVRTALDDPDAVDRTLVLESVEAGLSRLLTTAPADVTAGVSR